MTRAFEMLKKSNICYIRGIRCNFRKVLSSDCAREMNINFQIPISTAAGMPDGFTPVFNVSGNYV